MFYKNQTNWERIQSYLPASFQLSDDCLPNEYFLDWNNIKIHIDHYEQSNPKGTVIILHGVGGNGRLVSSIALLLQQSGYEVICPDLPLYGNTQLPKNQSVSYQTWIECGCWLVKYFQGIDRKVSLFGLSAGGLLAYQVACASENILSVLLTCILDQRIPLVTESTALSPIVGKMSRNILPFTASLFPNFKIPMKFVGNMKAIVNNPELAKILIADKRSSGTRVSLNFICGMLNPVITIEPEEFDKCPILLVHPENDQWTDVSLSKLFFDKIYAKKQLLMIPEAGHFPIKEVGLNQMQSACKQFLDSVYLNN
ncbi:hypothetical protein IGI39_000936 [Enterococcus sp. AZ135]|uniref:alpha/beta hydrolase n=1 Tax=unclassified Enterococcus TaxID=2608891 RepID=UPI003F1E56ED